MDGWVDAWMDGWMDGHNSVVHAHSGILFSLKKEGNSDTCYFTDAQRRAKPPAPVFLPGKFHRQSSLAVAESQPRLK